MAVILYLSHYGKNTDEVFENRALRRIFGPEREKVGGAWRRLHNELHNLYVSPNDQIKEDEMGGACSTHGKNEKCIQYFGRKT